MLPSKASAEALVSSYGNLKKIEHVVSLRFFNIFGEGQSLEYAGVITNFLEKISKGLPPIIYGDGKQTRDFISVNDVVNAILLAHNHGIKCHGQVFSILQRVNLSV